MKPTVEGAPRMYIEGRCDSCDEDLFAEIFRPALVERWEYVSKFWLQVLQAHVCKQPGEAG